MTMKHLVTEALLTFDLFLTLLILQNSTIRACQKAVPMCKAAELRPTRTSGNIDILQQVW